jgi:hypothetical protein
MVKGYVPDPVPAHGVKSRRASTAVLFFLATMVFSLVAVPLPALADAVAPAPDRGNFGQYLIDHQDILGPFFSDNAADIFRLAVPVVLGMVAWVIVITMVAGWAVDVLLSRGFAYFFAPAFAEIKRSVIYASGRLFLSFVYSGLLTLAIVFSLKLTYGPAIMGVAVVILLLVALAAQLVWILYLYRTNFAVSGVFYLAVIVVHTILALLIAEPIIGLKSNAAVTEFVDEAITPRLKAEAIVTRQQLAAAQAARDSVKTKATDLQSQVSDAKAEDDQLRAEIEAKKNSDLYVFSRIVQARARGELASAHDQLTAFLVKFPNNSMSALAHAQLDEINSQMVVVDTQKKQDEADALRATQTARADLLARAAKGEVTLSEMRRALIGKSRTDVKELLGLPMDTGTDSWGYRRQMILDPINNEKHGLTIYFSEGAVQGVDYDLEP